MQTNSSDISIVLARLDKLERQNDQLRKQNRHWKWLLVALTILLVALTISCQSKKPLVLPEADADTSSSAQGTTLEAEKFVLKGPDGKTQAVLMSGPDGPGFILFTPGEPPTPAIGMTSNKEGVPQLTVHDKKGRRRILLTVEKDDAPVMAVFDETKKERVRLTVEGNQGGLGFYDASHKGVTTIGMTSSGPSIALISGDKRAISLDVTPDFQVLRFLNAAGKPRAGISVTKEESGIDLFDDQGKLIFSKP